MTPTELAASLAKNAEATCRHLLPNGKLVNGEWQVGGTDGSTGKSMHVTLKGEKAGVWYDFATQETGDMFALWMAVKGADQRATIQQIHDHLGIPNPTVWDEVQAKMRPGTNEQLERLAALRKLPSIEGLRLATEAGTLFFGPVWDSGQEHESWIITDGARVTGQARRIDGLPWAKYGKAKTIHGTKARWPVGIHNARGKDIALVEGSPDFLAAWHFIWLNGLQGRIVPVCLMGASLSFHEDSIPLFAGRHVHAFPHADQAGSKAAARWESQCHQAGVASFRRFDLGSLGLKDLNDLAASEHGLGTDPLSEIASSMFDQVASPPPIDDLPLEPMFSEPAQPPAATITPRPITSFLYPEDDDPNILLGHDDYLGRGGGMLFVSHAGAGKSSWVMDACMMWALGKPWMGIRCSKPLKSLIIQAEDSDRYVGKIASSFAHVNKLAPEQVDQLTQNCRIIRLKGTTGPAFYKALQELTDTEKPDLVIINPIYLYAEGDITRSEFAQPFLVGLDKVNNAEKFAYILIHHTGKPRAKENGKRAETEDWETTYMGFGSSYFANWPRCSALLEPVPERPGSYLLKLGKGGLNAGVTKEVEAGVGVRHEPTTRIPIRHSRERMSVGGRDRPVYYWELDDEVPPPEHKSKGGRPKTFTLEQLAHCFPGPTQAPQTFNTIYNYAKEEDCGNTTLRELIRAEVANGRVEQTKAGHGFLYRLKI